MGERNLKQDVLALAGLIANIAEVSAELEVPTETAGYALDEAMVIVKDLAGEDSEEYAMLVDAKETLTKAIEEFIY